MTDFVLGKVNTPLGGQQVASIRHVEGEKYRKIYRYANFLKQSLKLSLFVPCDDDGNVLEEPNFLDERFELKRMIYEQAQSKVIFKGFKWNIAGFCDEPMIELENEIGCYLVYDCEDYNFQDGEENFFNTIEDLVKFNLELKNENKIF